MGIITPNSPLCQKGAVPSHHCAYHTRAGRTTAWLVPAPCGWVGFKQDFGVQGALLPRAVWWLSKDVG